MTELTLGGGLTVRLGENTALAAEARDAAALSAATAEAAAGPTYASTAAGLAATTDGEAFAVDNGDGTVTVYLNDGGVADEQRTLATTAALAASGGAALVGSSAGGDVQDQLTVNKVSPVQLGAAYDAATDDAPELTASFTEAHPKVGIGTTTPLGATTPFMRIGTTASIPYYGDLEGTGWRSRLQADANPTGLENSQGATTGQKRVRMLRANLNSSSNWVQQFPNSAASKISNLRFEAEDARDNGWQVTGFEFGGGQHFKDISFYGLTGGIRQMPTLYCDQVTAERLLGGGELIKTTDADDIGYLVNLPFTGDGILVSQCHNGGGARDESGNTKRGRTVYFKFKNGACIDASINGDHLIRDSRAVNIRGLHMEFGRAHFDGSTAATLSDSLFYKRGAGTDYDVAPVRVEIATGTTGVRSPVINLTNNGFHYGAPGGDHSLTTKDIEILSNNTLPPGALVHISMQHRVDVNDTNFNESAAYGVATNIPAFNTYSHMASVNSLWRNGAFVVEGSLPGVTAFSGAEMSAFTYPWRDWRIASGTYYYRIALLLDAPRCLGTLATGEVSATATLGGNGIVMTLNAVARRPGILRVYRGTSAGVYDSVVNVPLLSGGVLFDTGEDIAGFAWTSRTPGAADTVNAGSNGGFQLFAGSEEAGSDAYGRVVALFTSNTLPTTGSWRKGDRIDLQTPVATKIGALTGLLVGYRRMTNCTTASPSHVLNTDWAPIYEGLKNDATTTNSTDGDYTLTPGTSTVIQRSTATLTAARTITLAAGSEGDTFEITRSGGGAFMLDVGGLVNLAQGTSCKVGYSNGGWRLLSYSSNRSTAVTNQSSDAAYTLTPGTSTPMQRNTATLTADRTITLAAGVEGDWFEITRTGAGAFNLSVGGLKNLATNTWCKIVYTNSAWRLWHYGAL